MKVHIYETVTGAIKRYGDIPILLIESQIGAGEEFYLNCPPEATHIINNEPVTIIPEPIPPTEAEIIASLTTAVQAHLDSTARQRNYDGILSLCSYATSLDPVFKAEGQAGVEWRDACWRGSTQIMADVKAGLRDVPTADELLAELPGIGWVEA
jgi:hypothetical protein